MIIIDINFLRYTLRYIIKEAGMIINAISDVTSFNGVGNKFTALHNSKVKNISRKISKAADDRNLRGERRDMFFKEEIKKEMERIRVNENKAKYGGTLFD